MFYLCGAQPSTRTHCVTYVSHLRNRAVCMTCNMTSMYHVIYNANLGWFSIPLLYLRIQCFIIIISAERIRSCLNLEHHILTELDIHNILHRHSYPAAGKVCTEIFSYPVQYRADTRRQGHNMRIIY